MYNKLFSRMVACAVLAMVIGLGVACGGQTPEVSEAERQVIAVAAPAEVVAARNGVLEFLRTGANERVPPALASWTTDAGQAPNGFDVFRFTSDTCAVSVSYPSQMGMDGLYHVTLGDSSIGICWQANVDGQGKVAQTGASAEMLPELTNAAAAHCTQAGHSYKIREQANGLRCGVCIFANGSFCNAWAYFQDRCVPGEAGGS